MDIRAGALLLMLMAACSGEDPATIADLCGQHLNVPADVCECLGDRADAELTSEGRALLIATLEQDEARAAEIRSDISLADATEVATFFTTAPADCAAELSGVDP